MCAGNKDLNSTVICAATVNECPISYMYITNQNGLPAEDLSATTYVSKSDQSGTLTLKYTKESNYMSNAPLQSITLVLGIPCAFPIEQSVTQDSMPMVLPEYYPLERDGLLKECQEFYDDKNGLTVGVAADHRYFDIANMDPNEFEIQNNSGVY